MSIYVPNTPLVYSNEQAVLDQISNNNIPASKDFSFTYQVPQQTLVASDPLNLEIPLVYLPSPIYNPDIQFHMWGTFIFLCTSDTAGRYSTATNFSVRGVTEDDGLETTSNFGAPITWEATLDTTKTRWNYGSRQGAHILTLNVANVFPANPAPESLVNVTFCITATHHFLG